MKLGVFYRYRDRGGIESLVDIAVAAERTGLESFWVGEHPVLPTPRRPPSRLEPDEPLLDPIVALSFVAAHTSTLRLGTGIIVLPHRNPVVLAKEVASVDVLSGGRMILGVGAGYVEEEFAAIGSDFARRGEITDEFLLAMRSLWEDARPRFEGRHVSFGEVDAHPRPAQPVVPIVVGGNSPPAFRRAVRYASGWYGFALTPEQVGVSLDGLHAAAATVDRPARLGRLEVTVTPPRSLTADTAAAYAATGVDRLVCIPSERRGPFGEQFGEWSAIVAATG